jgi:hypothetical protein
MRGERDCLPGPVDAAAPVLGDQQMTHIKGLLRGPKFNGRHSTVIPSAIPAVEAARDSEHITKIALGVITPVKTGKELLKFSEVSGGLKME